MTRPTSEGHEGKRERIAGVFGRAASTYDQIGPRFFSLLGERLAALADIHRGQTVLDVACGRGASALPAAERVGSDGRVVGVDIAERMVDELTRDAARLGARNLEVAVMDAEDLKFPDGTFDRLLGGFCLFFFPRPERALAEMRRVLRPGGRLALSTWSKTDTGWRWLDDLVDSYLPGSASERHEEHAFTESPSGMREVLSRAGFEPVEVLAEAEELTYATEDEWWASLWTRGRRGALERIEAELGADGLARFEAEAREHLRAASGSVGQDVIRQVLPVLYSLAGKPGRELTGDPT